MQKILRLGRCSGVATIDCCIAGKMYHSLAVLHQVLQISQLQVHPLGGALMLPYLGVACMAAAASLSAYLQSPPSLEPPTAAAAGPAAIPVPFAHTTAVPSAMSGPPKLTPAALRARAPEIARKARTASGDPPELARKTRPPAERPPWARAWPPAPDAPGGNGIFSGRPAAPPARDVTRRAYSARARSAGSGLGPGVPLGNAAFPGRTAAAPARDVAPRAFRVRAWSAAGACGPGGRRVYSGGAAGPSGLARRGAVSPRCLRFVRASPECGMRNSGRTGVRPASGVLGLGVGVV